MSEKTFVAKCVNVRTFEQGYVRTSMVFAASSVLLCVVTMNGFSVQICVFFLV